MLVAKAVFSASVVPAQSITVETHAPLQAFIKF